MEEKPSKKGRTGAPAMAQWDQQCLGSAGTQVQSLAQHSESGIAAAFFEAAASDPWPWSPGAPEPRKPRESQKKKREREGKGQEFLIWPSRLRT